MGRSTLLFISLLVLYLSLLVTCFSRDTITSTSSLSDVRGESLVSAGKRFELGFFSPRPDAQRYVGIWHHGLSEQTPIWVANRDRPLSDSRDGVLGIYDGNLLLKDGAGKEFWSTDLEQTPYNGSWEARLSDSGNLVLGDQEGQNVLWQSFQDPTDTFLPGMKMDETLVLTSWKSQDDPRKGSFTFNQELVIRKSDLGVYWKSDLFYMENIEKGIGNLLSNFSLKSSTTSYQCTNFSRGFKSRSINCSSYEKSSSHSDYDNTRMVMNSSGEIQLWNLSEDHKEWRILWREPRDQCSVANACGELGMCSNSSSQLACECLPGYKPQYREEWEKKNYLGGCVRKSEGSSCVNDTFLHLTNTRVETPLESPEEGDEEACRHNCLSSCSCKAYSYTGGGTKRSPVKCFIWNSIKNLQAFGGSGNPVNLSVRVKPSDIGSTTRSCDPCGKNVIPYPLSSGTSCGDPMYSSFSCHESIGKVVFRASHNSTFDVKNIDPSSRSFVILAGASDNCPDGIIFLNQSLPFTLLNVSCDAPEGGHYNSSEIEISWKPPPEPTCGGPANCTAWPYSACNVTGNGTGRCICDTSHRWDPDALTCTPETSPIVQSGPHSRGDIPVTRIAVGATIVGIVVISSTIVLIYILMRKKTRKQGDENLNRTPELLYGTEKRLKDMISSEEFKEEDKKGIDVPFFDFESIIAATGNFSDANKLGQGGFGPVYKGTFPGGREMAIKRLSSVSGQGLEEFKNEVVLIAKLQHRNLVRLLGYCIKGDEKLLIYEYMSNRSLDFFIFAEMQRNEEHGMVLDWEGRFNIILGVARGLLYLHQDSRLRIIHRDLKTGNILLDDEMNPKISDFGLARIFQGKQTEGTTNRVIGTYGYMSPEYALDGLFSVKSDVFSFGVVLLEVLSGKRNTGYFQAMHNTSLLGYAWRLWTEGSALDLMDEVVRRESCDRTEFQKCVNVALLCVQDDPADRPTMSDVLVMLSSKASTLPNPKQPAFTSTRDVSETASSSRQEIVVTNSQCSSSSPGG